MRTRFTNIPGRIPPYFFLNSTYSQKSLRRGPRNFPSARIIYSVLHPHDRKTQHARRSRLVAQTLRTSICISYKTGNVRKRKETSDAAEVERRREVERSDPDFSISRQDACSLDRDKHQGHNKVWINEQAAISAATIEFESSVLLPELLRLFIDRNF